MLAVLFVATGKLAGAGPEPGTRAVFADGPAQIAPLAAKSLLLGVARAGDRLVAVGDRGHILVSVDHGVSWTQRPAPTRAMLTGVSFPDAQHGWASGHDGVILATTDGGESWTRQDGGGDLETVFLNVLFTDAHHGYVVGAYGKFFATADGGKTWRATPPTPDETHYNQLGASTEGILCLAGESGTLLLSSDQAATWTTAGVPYDGSLFGTVAAGPRTIVAFGLRGHIFTSHDTGRTWSAVPNDTKALIMSGLRLHNGVVVLAGQGGNFFVSRNAGTTFTPWKPEGFSAAVAALAEAADGALIAVGEAGATRLIPPAAEAP